MRVNEAAGDEVWRFRSCRGVCPPGTEKEKDVRNSGTNRLDTNRGIPLFSVKFLGLLRQIDGLAAENPGVFFLGVFVGDQDRLLRGTEVPALQKLADEFGIIAQGAADKQVADEFVGYAEGGGYAAGQNFCTFPVHYERDEKLAEVVGDGIRLLSFGVADDINRIFRKERHGGSSRFSAWGVFALLDVFLCKTAKSSVRRRELRKFVRY